MKAVTPLWSSPNTGATDESGFSGLPCGARSSNGDFIGLGTLGFLSSATGVGSTGTYGLILDHSVATISMYGYLTKSGFGVRCVRD
ncbi:MAG: hypothetical protein IPO05_05590 [Flavobacteriales bacterium]|nr:hypothetical protein [Flavobacteriales bacterium]